MLHGRQNGQYEKTVNLSREAYVEHLRKSNGPVHDVLKKSLTVDESLGLLKEITRKWMLRNC